MSDRPIIFSAPMVRALLDGRKTQTRRLAKVRWQDGANPEFSGWRAERVSPSRWQILGGMGVGANIATNYAAADRLYVREAWRARLYNQDVPPRDIDPWATRLHYEADGVPPQCDDGTNWNRLRSAIHMPRWVSRLTLTVTEVRAQRLQDISAQDSAAEGVQCSTCDFMKQSACFYRGCFASRKAFEDLWNSLHGPDARDANPWVVALTFTVRHGNIDT